MESDWTDIFESYAIVPFLRQRVEQLERERIQRQKDFTL
jgi:hypothetical protein